MEGSYIKLDEGRVDNSMGNGIDDAAEFGYSDRILETRVQNTHAIEFYKKCDFTHRSAFGKYVGNKNSYCFEKKL